MALTGAILAAPLVLEAATVAGSAGGAWLLTRGQNVAQTAAVRSQDCLLKLQQWWTRAPAANTSNNAIDPNRLNHIFGKAQHNLAPLLNQFGGNQQAAFQAVQNGAAIAAKQQGITGMFTQTINVVLQRRFRLNIYADASCETRWPERYAADGIGSLRSCAAFPSWLAGVARGPRISRSTPGKLVLR